MTEPEQIVAALLHKEAASRTEGVFRGPLSLLRDDAIGGFRVPEFEESFENALAYWEAKGALRRHQYPGVTDYVTLETGLSGVEMPIRTSARVKAKFRGDKPRPMDILGGYFDAGPMWLHDVALAFRRRRREPPNEILALDNIVPDEARPKSSFAWTGLPSNFQLTQEIQARLVNDLDRADAALATATVSQDERSQARAYIIAMRVLAEAPEPQADLIWEILGRANQISGIASLFVSIMGLFATVAH
jgi:hypothetical protein